MKEIILDTDQNAFKEETVVAYRSSRGNLFFNKRAAIYHGSTHTSCSLCNEPSVHPYTKCERCRAIDDLKRYQEYEFQAWDFSCPVYDRVSEKYFFHPEDVEEYLEESELLATNMQLLLCERSEYRLLDLEDLWGEVLPEDGEFPKALIDKVKELNDLLASLPGPSWFPCKVRTEFLPEEKE